MSVSPAPTRFQFSVSSARCSSAQSEDEAELAPWQGVGKRLEGVDPDPRFAVGVLGVEVRKAVTSKYISITIRRSC